MNNQEKRRPNASWVNSERGGPRLGCGKGGVASKNRFMKGREEGPYGRKGTGGMSSRPYLLNENKNLPRDGEINGSRQGK